MRAITYLKQLSFLNAKIRNKTEELERLRQLASGLGGFDSGEKVQTSSRGDSMERRIIDLIELEEQIADDLIEQIRTRQEILSTIELLPKNEYEVAFYYFVKEMEAHEIADKLEKSYSYVTKRKGKALKMVQEILDERIKEEGQESN